MHPFLAALAAELVKVGGPFDESVALPAGERGVGSPGWVGVPDVLKFPKTQTFAPRAGWDVVHKQSRSYTDPGRQADLPKPPAPVSLARPQPAVAGGTPPAMPKQAMAGLLDELVKVGAARALASRLTPESSNVRGYSYDPTAQALTVTFKSGGTYRYDGVPGHVAKALGRNKSVGKTINKMVKAKGYTYEKIGRNKYAWQDRLPGGIADDKTPKDFDPAALAKGIKVELEHTSDRRIALEVAMDHLTEDKAYYDKLEKMEKAAEDYTTKLSPKEESSFQSWVKKDKIPFDPGPKADYDMRGYWKAQQSKDPRATTQINAADKQRHFPDTWKTPYHKTLSSESIYAPKDAPSWQGNRLVDKAGKVIVDETPAQATPSPARTRSTPPPRPRPIGAKKGGSMNGTQNHWAKRASSVFSFFTDSRRWAAKLAGVAKKQATIYGLRVKIEHEPGDVRSGTSKDGKTWERTMHASYGYVPGTKGMGDDGDAIDVYVADDPQDGPVFEVDQKKREGGHDEMKYMVGYDDQAAAKADYLRHMPSWAFGSIKQVAGSARAFADQFKAEAA